MDDSCLYVDMAYEHVASVEHERLVENMGVV